MKPEHRPPNSERIEVIQLIVVQLYPKTCSVVVVVGGGVIAC